jgi:hypothetical protein
MNRKHVRIGLATGLTLAVVAVAGALALQPSQAREPSDDQSKPAPRCLDVRYTGRIHVVDDHTVLVYDKFDNAYKINHAGGCKSMDDYSQIGFVLSGGSDICAPHDAQILYSPTSRGARTTCIINGFSGVSKEEAARLDP